QSRPIFFRAGGAGMGADGGGIQNQHVQIRLTQRGQDRIPAALRGPAVEASPLAVAVAEPLGQVGPRNARTGDVQHCVDEPAIVFGDASMLSRLARQKVLDAVPVGIGNRVSVKHRRPSVDQYEGRRLPRPATLCPYGLVVLSTTLILCCSASD